MCFCRVHTSGATRVTEEPEKLKELQADFGVLCVSGHVYVYRMDAQYTWAL